MQNTKAKKLSRLLLLSCLASMLTIPALAEQAKPDSSMSNPFVVIMIIIILILALVIGLLANLVLGAAFVLMKKEEQDTQKITSSQSKIVAMIIALVSLISPAYAQDNLASTNVINGISSATFYAITGVIFLELLVIAVLLYNLKTLIRAQQPDVEKPAIEKSKKPRISLWDKLNKFKPVEQELAIDLGHSYDGIRELDNRLPPWWLYGFYATILFSCIYLWRYHVSHTAPSSIEEYQLAVKEATVQKEAYLKKAANSVDENSVKLLTDAADISAGSNIFQSVCAACHGKSGEGIVGPNLTDDYWLHGGDVKEIFKTIKYGWPEKGMKSWKDDYSPLQLAQLTSYIKSIHGTNPPNAKAPQGATYVATQASDSASAPVKADSAK
jgi:cytochrome c oxidase cbb3-type subunit III